MKNFIIAAAAFAALTACNEEPVTPGTVDPTVEQAQLRCENEAAIDPTGDTDTAFKACMEEAGFPVE